MDAVAAMPRLLSKREVLALTGLTESGIDNRVRRGTFPKPVPLDARQTAFVESEIRAWIAARIADRDAGVMPPGRDSFREARERAQRS